MRTEDLFNVVPADSSLFLDNLVLCSADRILSGNYEAVRGNPLLSEELQPPSAAGTLVAHDLINLSILVESLFCTDQIYLNADYVNRWNSEIGSGLLSALDARIVGITMARDVRWEAESAVVRTLGSYSGDLLEGADHLAQLVSHASHDAWSGHGLRDDAKNKQNKLGLLTPYNDEASRPFPSSGGLAVGAGFYVACSQVLGVPYRPSLIRAQILTKYLEREIVSWRYEAGIASIDILEQSAEEAVKYVASLAHLNLVEVQMPLILGAILKECRTADEVILYALQLRDRPEAAAFRDWSAAFGEALKAGEVKRIAKYVRELNALANRTNKNLGIAESSSPPYVGIGFGPVSISKPIRTPAFANFPIRIKSHAWLLQHLYASVVQTGRFSDEIERLFYPGLPSWLMNILRERPIIWRDIRWRSH